MLLPKSIGRLIRGCDASETSNDTRDAYKKGIASRVNPRVLRYAKIMNRVDAFNPIRIDNPTPMTDVESNAETNEMIASLLNFTVWILIGMDLLRVTWEGRRS